MAMHTILKIENVTKVYQTKNRPVAALKGISFTINQGEVFGLLGVNGAGKTTLSSILATLHPTTSGDILYNGISIYDNIYEYRKALGYCPQYQNLDPFLTVRENLLFAGRYFLVPEARIAAKTASLMHDLELEKYADFPIDALSGGNKQRALIARALMHDPKIVILDEPTVGLDPNIRRKLWDLIRALKSKGVTTIITTHYLDEAEYLSDRVCILHHGNIMLIESVEELKKSRSNKKLEDIFLDLMKEHDE